MSSPVKMGWILSAPTESKLRFVRGSADSDGNVHFKDKSVTITSSPNTEFVNSLLRSLRGRTHLEVYPGLSKAVLSAPRAAEMKIINPEVLTYRRKTLEMLVHAKAFERRWPEWLQAKAIGLLGSGLDIKGIRDRILEGDNVFVRLHTLRGKKAKHEKMPPRSTEGAGGGIRARGLREQRALFPDLSPGRL